MIWQFINESFMNSGEKIDSNPADSAFLAKSCNSVNVSPDILAATTPIRSHSNPSFFLVLHSFQIECSPITVPLSGNSCLLISGVLSVSRNHAFYRVVRGIGWH